AAGALMMRHLHTYRDHMVAFFTEQRRIRGERFAEVAARRRDFERLLEGLLRRGVDEGSLRPHDVRLTVLALLGMFNYGHQWYRPDGRLTPEQIGRSFIDLVLLGIGAEAGAAAEPRSADSCARAPCGARAQPCRQIDPVGASSAA